MKYLAIKSNKDIRKYTGINGKIYLMWSTLQYQPFRYCITLKFRLHFSQCSSHASMKIFSVLSFTVLKFWNDFLYKNSNCYLVSAQHFALPFLKFLFMLFLILETLIFFTFYFFVPLLERWNNNLCNNPITFNIIIIHVFFWFYYFFFFFIDLRTPEFCLRLLPAASTFPESQSLHDFNYHLLLVATKSVFIP